ncbi:aspartate racemase/maleate isomerase family protein [Streptomyces jumonjinensis]|uniref:aspartate racemase/maleate isomerase family protein n=1 Tax=Streptomyces jumonjinensis TaxID=1945 RepID=UPI0037977154
MTTVGLLYPGRRAEDDYPRLEVLLDSDIRLPVVRTDAGEDAQRVDALLATGTADRLAAGIAELRLAGAESLVWASASGSFVYGWEGAHQQIRTLARAAGLPASSASFGFVHAVRKLGVSRVAVGATYPQDITAHFTEFLRTAGIEVVASRSSGVRTAAEAAGWGRAELLELTGAADHPAAQAVLLPDTALRTAAHLPDLEDLVGKPVLTATQVTVWEGLRLADRRTWALHLGALFARPAEAPAPAAEPRARARARAHTPRPGRKRDQP